MTLNFNSDIVEPGENVTLNISSDPNSIVGICVIDQSVLLKAQPNELTNTSILNYNDNIKLPPYYPVEDNEYDNVSYDFNNFYLDRTQAKTDIQVSERVIYINKNKLFFIIKYFTF
jgi:hypothetical protein